MGQTIDFTTEFMAWAKDQMNKRTNGPQPSVCQTFFLHNRIELNSWPGPYINCLWTVDREPSAIFFPSGTGKGLDHELDHLIHGPV